MRRVTGWVALWTVTALATPARAQGPVADTAAVEYFAPEGALARAGMSFYGDLRLRWDEVRDRPGASGDLDLRRLMMRGGLIWAPAESPVQAEAGIRGTTSRGPIPVGNLESPWAPVLNEELSDLVVDRLGVRLAAPGGRIHMTLGRQRSPLRLTEMIWDDDLRPVGVAVVSRLGSSPTFAERFGLALFARDGLETDRGWLGAAQVSILFREDAASGGDATVSWLRCESDLAHSRQNETLFGPARFELIDLQLGARAALADVPLSLRLDVARNTAHPTDRDAIRVRLAIGGAGVPAGAEIGWVFQRIEREAVPGAFNSDDWWFHTRMRGHQAWLRIGLGGSFEAKLAGFHERRDDLARRTRRLTAELTARLPPR